ncbi:MAG: DUF389 domain-containing protein [Streptococcus parasanguinis]|nr:DUF389 domain-containing protein [Streptococcus parasanguinis]
MSGNYSTREFREKLYDDLHVRLRDTVILMCSIFIASIGLNMNSTAVIIGAMLISPLMTPIIGLGFGLAIFDTRLIKQSLGVLFTQVLVSLLVSTLYFWISPLSYASSELIARTSPTIWDVLIAIAGGIAGVIGSRKKEANNIVPGVAIATALMPPICTAGYGLANGNVRFLFGALYLFLINCVFIMLINIVGTRIMMRQSPLSSFNELNMKMKIGLISLIVLLVLPASYSAVTLTMDQARKEGIKQFVGKEFANHTIINQVYKSSSNELVLTVVGDPISEEKLETIRQKQASYGIQSVQLKVNQVHNSTKLDSEMTKEFYETINKYIDQKLSEKDSQDNIVKEIEADKD